jgi:hypothetical protein
MITESVSRSANQNSLRQVEILRRARNTAAMTYSKRNKARADYGQVACRSPHYAKSDTVLNWCSCPFELLLPPYFIFNSIKIATGTKCPQSLCRVASVTPLTWQVCGGRGVQDIGNTCVITSKKDSYICSGRSVFP